MRYYLPLLGMLFFIQPILSYAQLFTPTASYNVCFTPGENCTANVITALSHAKQTIFVQAYSFTSAAIAKALVESKKRGVAVKVILDKSQFQAEKYSSSTFLDHADIPVWIDAKPSIAHNKVMIIDSAVVITGSFNFTKAAEEKNAENLLIIQDPGLANQYMQNWTKRQNASILLENYQPRSKHKHPTSKTAFSKWQTNLPS